MRFTGSIDVADFKKLMHSAILETFGLHLGLLMGTLIQSEFATATPNSGQSCLYFALFVDISPLVLK